jgi:ketosteroid isomerase-like protein
MQPAPELADLTLRLYDAMSSGDADAVERYYSQQNGSLFIGTAGAEFWTDPAQHNADVRPYFDASHGRTRVIAGEPHAVTEGTVGWVVDRPTLRLADGTQFHVRLTVIWHLEAEGWRVAHTHTSVGHE